MQDLPQSARNYDRAVRREQQAAISAVRRQWRRMGPNFDTSWTNVGPTVAAIIATAQGRIARLADDYVPAVLEETGQTRAITAAARTNTAAFVGVTGSGVAVSDQIDLAPIRAKQARQSRIFRDEITGSVTMLPGLSESQALASAGSWLTAAAGTIMSDTARAVETTGMSTRPVGGYVRMLTPPSCGRCAVLAGKWFRKNQGFQRHPQCFPAGVVASGPSVDAATRRWFKGELVVLTTASGQELPVTGNHPILTSRGWIPANLLKEGDEVVRSTRSEGATPLVIPDHHQVPSLIEDVWSALAVGGLERMPTSPEDFHGDGQHGEVDIVDADRALGSRLDAAVAEHAREKFLAARVMARAGFDFKSVSSLLDLGNATLAGGAIRGGSLSLAFSETEVVVADLPGLAHAPALDPGLREDAADRPARDLVLLGERILTGPGKVLLHDLAARQHPLRPRWDAPAGSFSGESREGYAARGLDLLGRLSGQVELDRVVKLVRREFSGHVYSLTSSEGWHTANSLIVSNCDCKHIPASEGIAGDYTLDLDAYLNGLDEAGQIKLLGSRANWQAWNEYGADPAEMINAYKGGLRTAQDLRGTRIDYTGYGTSRGLTRSRMSNASRLDRDAGTVLIGGRARFVRRMPETILRTTASKEQVLRQLRLYGWVY